ncbi:unnamed protein product [Arabis nemorensis]|uniref:Uncharacterized protein n=1 Tax=Arabis nemorensis TaxID=586526 RepID=A0A565ATS7_9BRAS|nr:unnamed protein product [Arabis nemorensis]
MITEGIPHIVNKGGSELHVTVAQLLIEDRYSQAVEANSSLHSQKPHHVIQNPPEQSEMDYEHVASNADLEKIGR